MSQPEQKFESDRQCILVERSPNSDRIIINSNLLCDKVIGKFFYLSDGIKCFGIVKVERATETHYKPKLSYNYLCRYVKKFLSPKKMSMYLGNNDPNFFIRDLEFQNDVSINLGQSNRIYEGLSKYDPSKLTIQELMGDLKVVLDWYKDNQVGKVVINGEKRKLSLDDIENSFELILNDSESRKIKINVDEFESSTKKVYAEIKNNIQWKKDHPREIVEQKFEVKPFISKFDNATIINDFISVVGSAVETGVHDDIDLLVRMTNPSDYLKQSVENSISKMTPDGNTNIKIVWGENDGPHGTHIPLYDLILVRKEPKIIEISDKVELFGSIKLFSPMKPGINFYDVDELVKNIFRGK